MMFYLRTYDDVVLTLPFFLS